MTTDRKPARNGWWWKFTALLFGAPPIAVWAAQDEVEQERSATAAERRTRG